MRREEPSPRPAPKGWGSVARKGGRVVTEDQSGERHDSRDDDRRTQPPRPRPLEEVWIFDGVVDEGGGDRSVRPRRSSGRPSIGGEPGGQRRTDTSDLPPDVVAELTGAAGRGRAEKVHERMAAAASAYGRDRYPEALRITKVLVDELPGSASVQELHGLVCYRMGRWRQAITHLTAASELAGEDPTQLPVLMDCHRALGHHRKVRELWDKLRSASPSADILAEGRLVLAADLAERDEPAAAITVLTEAGAGKDLRHPQDRHVRQWYVLADLSERVGDLPRARELFARVARADPDLADATERANALGGAAPARPPRRPGQRGATVTLGELSAQARRGTSGRSSVRTRPGARTR